MSEFNKDAAIKSAVKRLEMESCNGYEGTMPSKDLATLEEGDVIEIQSGVKKIPMGRKRLGQPDTRQRYQANLAVVTRAGGAQVVLPISPSVFSRNAAPCEVNEADGKVTFVRNIPDAERLHSTGQPVDDFYTFDSLDEAMESFVGKKIKVKTITRGWSYNPTFMAAPQRRPYYVLEYVQL